MNWLQVVLLILKLLKQAKSASSHQEFVSSVQSVHAPLAANGAILQWIWDNREQIIAFVMTFFANPAIFRAPPTPGTASVVSGEGSEEAEVLALVEELKS